MDPFTTPCPSPLFYSSKYTLVPLLHLQTQCLLHFKCMSLAAIVMLARYAFLLWMFCRSSEVSVTVTITNRSVQLSECSTPISSTIILSQGFASLTVGLISFVPMNDTMLSESRPLLLPLSLMSAVCSWTNRYYTTITRPISVAAVDDQTKSVKVKLCCSCLSDHISSFAGQRWCVEGISSLYSLSIYWCCSVTLKLQPSLQSTVFCYIQQLCNQSHTTKRELWYQLITDIDVYVGQWWHRFFKKNHQKRHWGCHDTTI